MAANNIDMDMDWFRSDATALINALPRANQEVSFGAKDVARIFPAPSTYKVKTVEEILALVEATTKHWPFRPEHDKPGMPDGWLTVELQKCMENGSFDMYSTHGLDQEDLRCYRYVCVEVHNVA